LVDMDGALKVIDFSEIGFGIGSWSLFSTYDLFSKVFLKKIGVTDMGSNLSWVLNLGLLM
jgi:hypothetical protein